MLSTAKLAAVLLTGTALVGTAANWRLHRPSPKATLNLTQKRDLIAGEIRERQAVESVERNIAHNHERLVEMNKRLDKIGALIDQLPPPAPSAPPTPAVPAPAQRKVRPARRAHRRRHHVKRQPAGVQGADALCTDGAPGCYDGPPIR